MVLYEIFTIGICSTVSTLVFTKSEPVSNLFVQADRETIFFQSYKLRSRACYLLIILLLLLILEQRCQRPKLVYGSVCKDCLALNMECLCISLRYMCHFSSKVDNPILGLMHGKWWHYSMTVTGCRNQTMWPRHCKF